MNPNTSDLVDRFAAALKAKLAKAEQKYGYRDDWLKTDWKDELLESLAEHVFKGDPVDVAAYCAFAWHHGWSTSDAANAAPPAKSADDLVERLKGDPLHRADGEWITGLCIMDDKTLEEARARIRSLEAQRDEAVGAMEKIAGIPIPMEDDVAWKYVHLAKRTARAFLDSLKEGQ